MTALLTGGVPQFGKKFLEDIDRYIAERYTKLTCNDVWKIYNQFFYDMKEFKGNSNGFTGLSEYLIFRSVYHFLGGPFDQVEKTNDLYEFKSRRDQNLQISQSTPVEIKEGRRLYPDIGVSYAKKLLAVCQIKLYLTQGAKEVRAELKKLDDLKELYPDLQALLLVFNSISTKGRIMADLKNEASRRPWFQYDYLQGNNRILVDVLKESLDLDRTWKPEE
jgi:hypothetical protein